MNSYYYFVLLLIINCVFLDSPDQNDEQQFEQTLQRGLQATIIAGDALNALQPVELHAVDQGNQSLSRTNLSFEPDTENRTLESTDVYKEENSEGYWSSTSQNSSSSVVVTTESQGTRFPVHSDARVQSLEHLAPKSNSLNVTTTKALINIPKNIATHLNPEVVIKDKNTTFVTPAKGNISPISSTIENKSTTEKARTTALSSTDSTFATPLVDTPSTTTKSSRQTIENNSPPLANKSEKDSFIKPSLVNGQNESATIDTSVVISGADWSDDFDFDDDNGDDFVSDDGDFEELLV